MRTQRNLFYLSSFFTIVFLVLSVYFYQKCNLFYDICMGIFTGFFASALIALFSYLGEKRKIFVYINKTIHNLGELLEKIPFQSPNIDCDTELVQEAKIQSIRDVMDIYFKASRYNLKDFYEVEEDIAFILPISFQKTFIRQIFDKTENLQMEFKSMFKYFPQYGSNCVEYDMNCIYQAVIDCQSHIYKYEEISVADFNIKNEDLCVTKWVENNKCFKRQNYASANYIYDYNRMQRFLHPIKTRINKLKKIRKVVSDINHHEKMLLGKKKEDEK